MNQGVGEFEGRSRRTSQRCQPGSNERRGTPWSAVAEGRRGQEVCAYVVADGVTEATVQEHCRGELARFKVPKRIFLIDDLPKDPQGKVQKRVLVESTPQV